MQRFTRSLIHAALLLLCTVGTAEAACTSPAGAEGNMRYDTTTKQAYVCNNTSWVIMQGGRRAQIMLPGAQGTTTNFTANASTLSWVPLTLTTLNYDTGGFYNAAGHFVIPSGVTRVRVTANVSCYIVVAGTNTVAAFAILTNVSGAPPGFPYYASPTTGATGTALYVFTTMTGIMNVTAGQAVKLNVSTNTNPAATNQTVVCYNHAYTTMTIEEIN